MKNLWNTRLVQLVNLGLKQRKTKNLAEQVAKSAFYCMFLFTFAGPQILGFTNKRSMEPLFYSSSLSSCSRTRKEFVQLDPLHWLQACEYSKLCLRHEHRMVLHPDLKLHLTMCRRLSGAGDKSVITENTWPSFIRHPHSSTLTSSPLHWRTWACTRWLWNFAAAKVLASILAVFVASLSW